MVWVSWIFTPALKVPRANEPEKKEKAYQLQGYLAGSFIQPEANKYNDGYSCECLDSIEMSVSYTNVTQYAGLTILAV